MIDANRVLTAEICKKTITSVIQDYLLYLKHCGLSKSTITKYKSILNGVLLDLKVPFMNLDSELVNKRISELYLVNHYSESHLRNLVRVTSNLFSWAKYNDLNRPYTLQDLVLINPLDNKKMVTSKTKLKETENYNMERQNISYESDSTGISSYPMDTTLRDDAIKSLLSICPFTCDEISELNICDFTHDYIKVHSKKCSEIFRNVPLTEIVRSKLYKYLSTRTDHYYFLFESNRPGKRITIEEIYTLNDLFYGGSLID